MTDIDAMERLIQNEVGWGSALVIVFTRLREMDAALRQIASCKSHAPGDVVDIARQAIT